LADPAALERGLRERKSEKDTANEPTRRRLAVIDDLLADNHRQLERLLDLYLSGEFPKDVLTDRKARLETTIRALDKERAGLVAQLETDTLSEDQIKDVLSLAAAMAPGLEEADDDFGARRVLIGKLDVQAVLTTEADGHQVIEASSMLNRKMLDLRQTAFVL
jgi:multidrug efflux pump subunit AcrA (membrane-fusion protein)